MESLKTHLKGLIGAIRSVNKSHDQMIKIEGDDDPCFWQRKEWIDWILELAMDAEKSLNDKDGDALQEIADVMEKHVLTFQAEHTHYPMDGSEEICLVICNKDGSAHFEITHHDNYAGIITSEDIKAGEDDEK